MKKILKILYIIFFLSISITLFSQTSSNEIITTNSAYSEDFSSAIQMYKKMILFDNENPVFKFKLGFCYLNTAGKEDSSIIYFKEAEECYDKKPSDELTMNDIRFYLGKAYSSVENFDSAIIVLENLKKDVTDEIFMDLVKAEIILAAENIRFQKDGMIVDIENLGNEINTSFSEHSPAISEDSSILIFTSRKKGTKSEELLSDGQYDENIYISKKIEGKWTSPEPIENINTSDNEASISLSPDGTTLFIYKQEDKGTIYYSENVDGTWTTPIKLGKNINTRNRETHATITRDGKTLYFTSERFGGYGGLDIYVSTKQADGTWGKPKNLGEAVNSKGDEDGPFISPDGDILHFSSEGHGGYGGFDLYKSYKSEFGTWTMAENLGYPINTIEDDAFYCPIDSTFAIYTSRKEDGFGQMDIYLLSLTKPTEDSLTVMTAVLTGCEAKIPYTLINIKDNTTGKRYIATPSENGKFIFIAYKGNNYNLTLTYENQDIYYDNFDIPKDAQFIENYKVIDIGELIYCE